jgi:fido (protein-threonine AMPylation protein)
MPTPHEKLAAALERLKELQSDGRRVFRSSEIGSAYRQRLAAQGFLREVIKGWVISASPSTPDGDTTPWYASFWEFCARYSESRFRDQWHLSPEESLLLHAESTVIPQQVIVYSPKGTNNTINLPFGTSLYDLRQKKMPPRADLTMSRELRLYAPAAALIRVSEAFFAQHPLEAQVILAGMKDPSDVLARLLEGGHPVVAGRVAGAFRRIGRADFADEILKTMKSAGYEVRESDPFSADLKLGGLRSGLPPIVGRVRALWDAAREPVIAAFPKAPGLPADKNAYLRFVDEIYTSDAYHSLSIEGYSVTPELIDRVRSGSWNPEGDEGDKANRDALAARGYWQAFQLVKKSVAAIIGGAEAGSTVRSDHRDWYRELFEPSVTVGLIRPAALAGYRHHAVFLRGSRHVPPNWEVVTDAMATLFDLIEEEREPSVRAVLGHWLFGYIHPYPDGNGRMARFLMNAMLASGGYPWTVIRVEDRAAYLTALETASVNLDIKLFAAFIAERVEWSAGKAA